MSRADLLLPLAVIIGTLLSGMSPMRAALLGIGTAFVLSFLRSSTRLGPRGMLDLLIAGARMALPVIAACATAGIVAGTVTSTGLGGQLGRGLVEIAGGTPIFPERRHAGLARDRIVSAEEVRARDPEVILASWCGKRIQPARIASRPGWETITAVKRGRIHEIKSSLILQPGPAALTDGVRQIAAHIRAACGL